MNAFPKTQQKAEPAPACIRRLAYAGSHTPRRLLPWIHSFAVTSAWCTSLIFSTASLEGWAVSVWRLVEQPAGPVQLDIIGLQMRRVKITWRIKEISDCQPQTLPSPPLPPLSLSLSLSRVAPARLRRCSTPDPPPPYQLVDKADELPCPMLCVCDAACLYFFGSARPGHHDVWVPSSPSPTCRCPAIGLEMYGFLHQELTVQLGCCWTLDLPPRLADCFWSTRPPVGG